MHVIYFQGKLVFSILHVKMTNKYEGNKFMLYIIEQNGNGHLVHERSPR